MGELTDRIILMVCCFLLTLNEPIDWKSILILLIAVTLNCAGYYLDRQWFRIGYTVIFVVLGMIRPEAAAYYPVVFYDICHTRIWGFSVAGTVVCTLGILAGHGLISALLIMLLILSGIMEYRTRVHEELKSEFKRLRDTSQELNMELKNKNKVLMENQEYQIRAATLSERNRIAREIHDNVGHMLSRSILQVGAMMAVNKQENLKSSLLDLKSTLNTAMDSIRNSVHDLRDQAFVLENAVNKILEDYSSYHISFEYDMSEETDQQVKYCFLTTVKEALTNTAKHSDADRITIIMREHPAFYQLLIEDNGSKKARTSGEGMGLANMRERAEALQGTIRISGDTGFRVFLSIPKGEEAEN